MKLFYLITNIISVKYLEFFYFYINIIRRKLSTSPILFHNKTYLTKKKTPFPKQAIYFFTSSPLCNVIYPSPIYSSRTSLGKSFQIDVTRDKKFSPPSTLTELCFLLLQLVLDSFRQLQFKISFFLILRSYEPVFKWENIIATMTAFNTIIQNYVVEDTTSHSSSYSQPHYCVYRVGNNNKTI